MAWQAYAWDSVSAHEDVSGLMNRVRQPFNVNSIGLAGAVAALEDVEFVKRSYALNQAGMLQITTGLRQLGIEYIPSYGNFLSFRVPGDVKAVNQSLLKQGIIVRPIGIYEMPQHLRVTVGLESENRRFLKSLELALGTQLHEILLEIEQRYAAPPKTTL